MWNLLKHVFATCEGIVVIVMINKKKGQLLPLSGVFTCPGMNEEGERGRGELGICSVKKFVHRLEVA